MVDRQRVLSRISELDGYLVEIEQIRPEAREQYEDVVKRRACERLLQISIETVVTICQLLVAGLRLGLPAEENDLFTKLSGKRVISIELAATLQRMKGFRNILVHEYGRVDDEIVFTFLSTRIDDFTRFRSEVLQFLNSPESP